MWWSKSAKSYVMLEEDDSRLVKTNRLMEEAEQAQFGGESIFRPIDIQ
ncbi:hypothetical protein LINGRAHAP2_LOCUS24240 [Linum grandiflorum]